MVRVGHITIFVDVEQDVQHKRARCNVRWGDNQDLLSLSGEQAGDRSLGCFWPCSFMLNPTGGGVVDAPWGAIGMVSVKSTPS